MTVTPNLDALNNYIHQVKSNGFQWHTNDCVMFTNNAFKAMYGVGWADDWIGAYTKDGLYMKANELRKAFAANTLTEAIDKKLKRIDYVPPRGALITTKAAQNWVIDEALGIAVGSKGVFLGKKSVISVPIEDINNAWVKE